MPAPIPLWDVSGNVPTITITQPIFTSYLDFPDTPSSSYGVARSEDRMILQPTLGENFPEINNGWISNVAIMYGYLRIQLGRIETDATLLLPTFFLVDRNGQNVPIADVTYFMTDKNLRILPYYETLNMHWEDRLELFFNPETLHFQEFIFPIDMEHHHGYSLKMRVY